MGVGITSPPTGSGAPSTAAFTRKSPHSMGTTRDCNLVRLTPFCRKTANIEHLRKSKNKNEENEETGEHA
jgi:hypothetical protein